VVLGVLLAAGAYVRTVGEATAVGVLAWAWWRDRRGGLAASAAFVLLMLPWWVRDVTLAGGWRYLEELRSATYQDPSAGSVSLADLLGRAAGNAAFVLGKPGALGALGIVGGAIAGVLLLVGYWRTLRTVGGAAEWAVIPLVLAVLVWPIRTGRYLLPVVPLACIYGLVGGLVALAWLSRRLDGMKTKDERRRTKPERTIPSFVLRLSSHPLEVVLALGLAFALFEALYTARESAANVRALAAGAAPAAYYRSRPDWAHYLEAAAWVRDHAGPGDVALTRRHFAFYVYSGHFTDKYRFDVSDEELDYLTHGLGSGGRRFVVEDGFAELRGDFSPLPAALQARGYDLQLRFESAPPAVRVWELMRRAP
jgi:hypothetical protein